MKPNCSTANRTSVRVKSSSRSPRSAAASRGSKTLCRPSLPTAEASTVACATPAKWCADSTQCAPVAAMDDPSVVNHSPAAAMDGSVVAADTARDSAASANASTGSAVQTPTPAAAHVVPVRPSAIDSTAAKKTSAAAGAPAARSTSGDGPSAAPARPSAIDGAAAKKPSAPHVAPAAMTTSGDGPSAAPVRPSAIDGTAAKKTSAAAGGGGDGGRWR